MGYSPQGRKESDSTELHFLSFFFDPPPGGAFLGYFSSISQSGSREELLKV